MLCDIYLGAKCIGQSDCWQQYHVLYFIWHRRDITYLANKKKVYGTFILMQNVLDKLIFNDSYHICFFFSFQFSQTHHFSPVSVVPKYHKYCNIFCELLLVVLFSVFLITYDHLTNIFLCVWKYSFRTITDCCLGW